MQKTPLLFPTNSKRPNTSLRIASTNNFNTFVCSIHHQDKESVTFKDNDFTKENVKIYIGEEVKKTFLERLQNDVKVSIVPSY